MKLFFTILVTMFVVFATLPCLGENQNSPVSPPLQLQNSPHSPQAQQSMAGNEIQDIRGPIELPKEVNYLLFIIALCLLLLLAALIFFYLKRKKNNLPVQDPGELALSQLKDARDLLTEGNGRIYSDRVSEILRHYIEKKFRIHSTRQTTSEFLRYCSQNIQYREKLKEHTNELKECLESCDMAKFAHDFPTLETMKRMESSVKDFVVTTTSAQQGEN